MRHARQYRPKCESGELFYVLHLYESATQSRGSDVMLKDFPIVLFMGASVDSLVCITANSPTSRQCSMEQAILIGKSCLPSVGHLPPGVQVH